MTPFMFIWVIGVVVAAWGLIAAGFNGDDGWSVVFLAGLICLIVVAFKVGWFA